MDAQRNCMPRLVLPRVCRAGGSSNLSLLKNMLALTEGIFGALASGFISLKHDVTADVLCLQ
eukprot:SAG31_NODE_1042_length_10187_cov_54.452121_7_plen_62_part_00